MATLKKSRSSSAGKSTKKVVKKSSKQTIHDIDRVVAALSYVWIFVLIPYVFFHNHKWVYAHARQGVALFVFELILLAISIIPILGWMAAGIGWLFVVVVAIIGIAHALSGEAYEIPILSKYAPKK